MKVPTCRGCGRAILWAKTERGRKVPLDPDPVKDGNIVVTAGGVAHVLRSTETPTGATYIAHFKTCPKAEAFRRVPAP